MRGRAFILKVNLMELSHHTVKAYDAKLNELLDLILQMGGRVRSLVLMVKRAMRERSAEVAAAAAAEDKEINRLEAALEQSATVILALQNPLAVDLRFVTSALKISGVLERAGDLAKNTIKRTVELGGSASEDVLKKMDRMSDIIIEMLDETLVAVKERDADLALAVWRRDDEVDALYREAFAVAQGEMQKNPGSIPVGTHLVFMAKNLERLADYVTNVAKTVYYIATGTPADKSLIRGEQPN